MASSPLGFMSDFVGVSLVFPAVSSNCKDDCVTPSVTVGVSCVGPVALLTTGVSADWSSSSSFAKSGSELVSSTDSCANGMAFSTASCPSGSISTKSPLAASASASSLRWLKNSTTLSIRSWRTIGRRSKITVHAFVFNVVIL